MIVTGRRLNLPGWLVVWAGLCALQVAAVAMTGPAWPDYVLILQLAKLPFAAARLRDLGRSPEDSTLTVVPLANLGLWWQLLERTPAEDLRQKRLSLWSLGSPGQLAAGAAVRGGLGLLARGLPVFLGLAVPAGLAYGGVHFAGIAVHEWIVAAPKETADLALDGMFAVTGLLGLSLLIQFVKRKNASRGSWIPILLALPALLFALAMQFRGARDQELLVLSFVFTGLDLLWGTFIGAVLSGLLLSVAHAMERDPGLTPQAALLSAATTVRQRLGDLIAIHGGVYQAVILGMQIVIPGVHYAVVYSLADMCVLFEPEQPSFRRSAQLTAGIRRRVFVTQVMVLGPYVLGSLVVGLATSSVADLVAGLFDPTKAPAWSHLVSGPIWMLTVVVLKLSLYQIWRDRVRALEPA
jgi:hypothetical protein